MHGETLRLEFKPVGDVTIAEVRGETTGGFDPFELDSSSLSTPRMSGTVFT
jgi:hypothetical protein